MRFIPFTGLYGKTLKKYGDGVPYLDAQWIGNDALETGDVFIGKSPFLDNPEARYECMGNELKIDSAFRQRTKGRALNTKP